MSATQFRTIDSPVGPLTLAGKGDRLMHLRMVDQTHEPAIRSGSLFRVIA
jgi:methylated-DNA-[protein]-cysteine S-methyltransferase